MNRLTLLLVALLIGCLGCGGNQRTSPQSDSSKGTLTFKIRWPKKTRLIPASSQSIVVTVYAGIKLVGKGTATRPAAGQTTSTVEIPGLPSGTETVFANAYPTTDGTGASQATGQKQITINPSTTASVTLSMSSTVATLSVTPNPLQLNVGSQSQLMASAADAGGDMVLLTSGTLEEPLTWSSSDATIATVSGASVTATVTGVKAGTATVSASFRVTDGGTTVSGSATVTVGAALPTTYHIVDLGALGGGSSFATALNENGQVTGTSTTNPMGGNAGDAFIATAAGMTDLGDWQEENSIEGNGINSAGSVVATWNDGAGSSGVLLYSNGSVTPIGSGSLPTWHGHGINASGSVVGTELFVGNNPPTGFLYSNGVISTFPNYAINAINDSGQMAGVASPNNHLVILTASGQVTDLGTMPDGTTVTPAAINANAGIAGTTNASHGFLYAKGSFVDLGVLPGFTYSEALGMNALGYVVGDAWTGATYHAFVYSSSVGMQDLNSLTDSSGKGWLLKSAVGINGSGMIAGTGITPQGSTHAFLALPNP